MGPAKLHPAMHLTMVHHGVFSGRPGHFLIVPSRTQHNNNI